MNAAKWSDERHVSVFAEARPESVSLLVRDRGRGFDPDDLPTDRSGIAHSIMDRVRRSGASVQIRSAPGAGCEVELEMPKSAAR